jgi:NTE family protein
LASSDKITRGHDLPVELLASELALPKGDEGIALCLSGGGYRAMVFHLGALWRLYELGILGKVARISSVSGGSITAGALALAWPRLSFQCDATSDFVPHVVEPVRSLAGRTIDSSAIIGGSILPGSIADKVTSAYDTHLFHGATLQDLPNEPRFVINATNVQSGVLWRFSKPYMRDWRVGEVKEPKVSLARAVAASSAFPPVLSPLTLELDSRDFTPGSGADLQREPFTSEVVLTDGGVYDNLGLETCFKRYQTVLVSDGGGRLSAEEEPKADWARHAYRILNLIDNQVRSLRKRQLIAAFQSKIRQGAYWSTWTEIGEYQVALPLACPADRTRELAETPTRLKRLSDELQERLINWGYAVCDAALRAYMVDPPAPPRSFPYPQVGV